eukprot:scaffold4_cov247-Pinguiococcus_pyrenoidosus.AAC.9
MSSYSKKGGGKRPTSARLGDHQQDSGPEGHAGAESRSAVRTGSQRGALGRPRVTRFADVGAVGGDSWWMAGCG